MKVVVAAGGRFHAFHLAKQLYKKNMLKRLYTGSYTRHDKGFIPSRLVSQHGISSFLDQLSYRLPLHKIVSPTKWYTFKDNLFDHWLSRALSSSREQIDIFTGWAHYWLHSLPVIKARGAVIVIECGSMHILEQMKLLEEEYQNYGISCNPISSKNLEKILREYEAADYIMIPSHHVYESFIRQGVYAKKLLCVPYGVNVSHFQSVRFYKKNEPFRVLFVGAVGLRKGIHYLLQAWRMLKLPMHDSELLIIGPFDHSFEAVRNAVHVDDNIRFMGSISHQELPYYYKKASLFVLPSIEEGLAMVQAEAMASGVPVIGTTNTGGSALIDNGKEGFIVPIRDVIALAEKIQWCYDNREQCFDMGLTAQRKIQHYTWDHYGEKVIKAYETIMQKNE